MQEIPLGQPRRIGTRQADRQIDAQRHRAARPPARAAGRGMSRTSPTGAGAATRQALFRRAMAIQRLRGSMLQSACAAIALRHDQMTRMPVAPAACMSPRAGLQRLVRALQQAGQAGQASSPASLVLGGLLLGAGLGLLLALLAAEPLVQAHAGLRGALRLVGTLAFGQGLWRLQGAPPLVAPVLAGWPAAFKTQWKVGRSYNETCRIGCSVAPRLSGGWGGSLMSTSNH